MSDQEDQLFRLYMGLIRYPSFNRLHREIQECQRLSKMANEPQCMSLEGTTGAGKSTLVKTYAAQFERIETPGGSHIPVFYVETPSPVTVKGMAAAMLAALGDPAADRGQIWSMNTRLVKYLINCHVQLVILDDFHHLIDKKTDRVLEVMSDWLKVIIKESGVPFLVVGVESMVERVLVANAQLSRLFAVRETLKAFQWDSTNAATLKEFAGFVTKAEEAIGLALTATLPRSEMLFRIHYATDGIVGNLMNLMRGAAVIALDKGQSHIELYALSSTFNKRLAKHLRGKLDPFAEKWGEHFVPPTKK